VGLPLLAEGVGILSAGTPMWEMEAPRGWLSMVWSHFRTEIGPI
jgi:hypothetical protein